jgi:hypothetical protein
MEKLHITTQFLLLLLLLLLQSAMQTPIQTQSNIKTCTKTNHKATKPKYSLGQKNPALFLKPSKTHARNMTMQRIHGRSYKESPKKSLANSELSIHLGEHIQEQIRQESDMLTKLQISQNLADWCLIKKVLTLSAISHTVV